MFTSLTTFILIVAAIISGYYLILFLVFRKKLVTAASSNGKGKHWMQINQVSGTDFPHELIDRPGADDEDTLTISLEKENHTEQTQLEMVDDAESVLLKAAEIVVEKVQNVVNHIASSPPNREEVSSKIKSIVRQYRIFENTEYYDAINSFIAITVERDCSIKFSKEELLSLWN